VAPFFNKDKDFNQGIIYKGKKDEEE